VSLVDRIAARRRGGALDWPVGRAVVEPFERVYGHDSERHVPESYGDYLVTSNEVYSACLLRSRLASLPSLRLYRGNDAAKRELPLSPAAKLLRHVNPFWSAERLARMDELAMGVWGATAWALEPGKDGRPAEIWWLKPSRLKPVPHPDKYLAGFLYESNVGGETIPFTPDEIVWFRYPNPLDEYSALSPIVAARLAADTGSAAMKSNKAMHVNGLQIAGVLAPKTDKVSFTAEQAGALEDDLQRRFAGADRAHKWAVLRYEAEFKPVNITPKDAEYINGLGITARMIYNAYGIPAPLLNDLQHATLANLRELTTIAWENALVPDMKLRAGDIREQYLPRWGRYGYDTPDHCEYDFSQISALQTSHTASWDRDRQAIEVGSMTINEWRTRQGMPPVPWGDVWWAPVNKSAVTSASSRPQGDTSPTQIPSARDDDVIDGEVVDPELQRGMRGLLAALERGGPR